MYLNIINITCAVLSNQVLMSPSAELSNVTLEPCKSYVGSFPTFHYLQIFQPPLTLTYTVFELPVVPVNHVCALIVNLVHLSALMY